MANSASKVRWEQGPGRSACELRALAVLISHFGRLGGWILSVGTLRSDQIMPTRLYLDSARMGLLSERARRAHLDYVRLAATEGCSLYFSRLLENGYQDWPANIQAQYGALRDWQGLHELEGR